MKKYMVILLSLSLLLPLGSASMAAGPGEIYGDDP